jgi:hypothetical protein
MKGTCMNGFRDETMEDIEEFGADNVADPDEETLDSEEPEFEESDDE